MALMPAASKPNCMTGIDPLSLVAVGITANKAGPSVKNSAFKTGALQEFAALLIAQPLPVQEIASSHRDIQLKKTSPAACLRRKFGVTVSSMYEELPWGTV